MGHFFSFFYARQKERHFPLAKTETEIETKTKAENKAEAEAEAETKTENKVETKSKIQAIDQNPRDSILSPSSSSDIRFI